MKVIYHIAKTELQLLFYSPVAWFVLIMFSIQSGSMFANNIAGLVEAQEMGRQMSGITNALFVSPFGGIFTGMQGHLYLYIPLLTMGLVSRELSSKSIQLLYSSPVTNFQIIMGKYLSMMIYGLVMMGILFLMVLCAWPIVEEFNIGMVLTGLLGLYLLLCAYAAVGIFMSSLTSYQIVAALSTFAVLTLLSMVQRWGQEYDIVRDITYWLGISGRSSQFIRGLICSEDVLYFILVPGLFLALTIIRLNAVRQKIRFSITFGRNIGVILLVCFGGYITSLPAMKVYYDATTTKVNTLTPNSQDIVKKLGDTKVTITSYNNVLATNGYSHSSYYFLKPDMERFEQYLRFKPDIKLEYVNYYDDVPNPQWDNKYRGKTLREKFVEVCKVCKLDTNRFITPEEIKQQIDLSEEGNAFVRQIVTEDGRKTWLRVYNDMAKYPSEREITAALKRLIADDLPLVGFYQGHGARNLEGSNNRDYSTFASDKHFRQSLLNQGFDVKAIGLEKPIPEDIDILLIADIREALSPEERANLQQYIDRGGNMYLLAEPRRREAMGELLAEFGFKMTEGVLVRKDPNVETDLLVSPITQEARDMSYNFGLISWISQPSVAGLVQTEDKGFDVKPLLTTRMDVWNEVETTDFIDDTIRLNPAVGEVQQPYNTVVALSRQVGAKEQRIILTGDADCISNGELRRGMIPGYMGLSNYVLIMGGFHWLSNEEMPIDIRRPALPDNKLYLSSATPIKWSFKIILPIVLAILGTVIWLRRRSR